MPNTNQQRPQDTIARPIIPITHNYALRNLRGRQRHRHMNNRLDAMPLISHRRSYNIPLHRLSQIPSSAIFQAIHSSRHSFSNIQSNRDRPIRSISEPRYTSTSSSGRRTITRTPSINTSIVITRPLQRTLNNLQPRRIIPRVIGRIHTRIIRTRTDHIRCNFMRSLTSLHITLPPNLLLPVVQSLPNTPSHFNHPVLPIQSISDAITDITTPSNEHNNTTISNSPHEEEEAIRLSPDSLQSTIAIPTQSLHDIQQHVTDLQDQFRSIIDVQHVNHQQQQHTLQQHCEQQRITELTTQDSLHQQQLETTQLQSQASFHEQTERYNTLYTEYNNHKQSTEQLHQQYINLNTRFNTLEQQHKSLQTQNNTLHTKYTDSQTQHTIHQEQYTSLNDKYNTLETQYTTAQTQYTVLQDQYTALQQRYTTLNEQHNTLRQTYTTLQQQCNTLKCDFQAQSYTSRIQQEQRQRIHQRSIQAITTEYTTEINTLKKRIDKLLEEIHQLQFRSPRSIPQDIQMAPIQPPTLPSIFSTSTPPRREEPIPTPIQRTDTTPHTPTIQDMAELFDSRIQTIQTSIQTRLEQHLDRQLEDRLHPIVTSLETIHQNLDNNNYTRSQPTRIPISFPSRTDYIRHNNRIDSTEVDISELDNTTNKPFVRHDIETFLHIPNDRLTEQETHAFLDRIDNHLSKDPMDPDANAEARALRKLIPHTKWPRLAEWTKIYINSDVQLSYSRLTYWRKRLDESAVRCYPTVVSSNLDNKFNMKRIAEALDGIQKVYTTGNRNSYTTRFNTPFGQNNTPNNDTPSRPPFNNTNRNFTSNNNNNQNRNTSFDRNYTANNRYNTNYTPNNNNYIPNNNNYTPHNNSYIPNTNNNSNNQNNRNPNNATNNNFTRNNNNNNDNTRSNNTPNFNNNRNNNRETNTHSNNDNHNNDRNQPRTSNTNNNEKQKPFPQRYMNVQQFDDQSDNEQQYDNENSQIDHPDDVSDQNEDDQPDFL